MAAMEGDGRLAGFKLPSVYFAQQNTLGTGCKGDFSLQTAIFHQPTPILFTTSVVTKPNQGFFIFSTWTSPKQRNWPCNPQSGTELHKKPKSQAPVAWLGNANDCRMSGRFCARSEIFEAKKIYVDRNCLLVLVFKKMLDRRITWSSSKPEKNHLEQTWSYGKCIMGKPSKKQTWSPHVSSFPKPTFKQPLQKRAKRNLKAYGPLKTCKENLKVTQKGQKWPKVTNKAKPRT